MKYVDKILRWLFGLDEIDEWEAAYNKLNEEYENAMAAKEREHDAEIRKIHERYHQQHPTHDVLIWNRYFQSDKMELLDQAFVNEATARLFKVPYKISQFSYDIAFVIQLRYHDEDADFTVRIFVDTDTEYAENCAREAFEYLTKKI